MEFKIAQTQSNNALKPPIANTQVIHKQPFVSALLVLKDLLQQAFENIDSSQSDSAYSQRSTAELSSIIDTLHFGIFQQQLAHLKEQRQFLPMIKERRLELREQKEHWRSFVDCMSDGKDLEMRERIENTLKTGRIVPNPSGAGSAYFILNAQDEPCFVVKTVDGDIFCLNNRKEFASPFNDVEHRARDSIPLYRSAQTDALCWKVAVIAGLEETTPQTIMGILEDGSFYDLTLWLEGEVKDQFIHETGMPDKEKLCSIQAFIADSQDLTELLHEFYAAGLSDEEIASHFDQRDFEQVCMLLWLSYDNDAHGGNFRIYIKRIDATGKKIYGIKKIDNGLSFPEKNTQYTNILTWMPNATTPVSRELKQKIENLPVVGILQQMDAYELFDCKSAFKERIEVLKALAQREGITVGEIDLRMNFLSKEGGKDLALSSMTTQQILELLVNSSSEAASCTGES